MNDDVLKLKNQLCFRLYAVSRNMTRLYQPILEKYGLTYPQYIIMLIMFEHQSIDFKDLSHLVDLKTGTLTPIIQKLEEMGYVVKEKNTKDARRLNVNITSDGVDLKEQLIEVPYALSQKIGLDMTLYNDLVNNLDTLLERLQKAQID